MSGRDRDGNFDDQQTRIARIVICDWYLNVHS
jgi:hypothetical protein